MSSIDFETRELLALRRTATREFGIAFRNQDKGGAEQLDDLRREIHELNRKLNGPANGL